MPRRKLRVASERSSKVTSKELAIDLRRLEADARKAYLTHYRSFMPETELVGLSAIEKAEAWLRCVALNCQSYAEQEALVYFASRGESVDEMAKKIIPYWKRGERFAIESRYGSSAMYLEGDVTGNDKSKANPNEASTWFTDRVASKFWDTPRDFGDTDMTIDATMFRTMEWCDIGGFDDWWKRYAANLHLEVMSSGVERGSSSHLFLFSLCRSDYAMELLRGDLEFILSALEVPEHGLRFPWQAWVFQPNRVAEVVEYPWYLAGILFARRRLRGASERSSGQYLDTLLKMQGENGAWKVKWSAPYGERDSVVETAIAMHALALEKPRGFSLCVSNGAKWLLENQDEGGFWYELSMEPSFVTVLVLDALSLASDKPGVTFDVSAETTEIKGRRSSEHEQERGRVVSPTFVLPKGDVVMGDKIETGSIQAGILNMGRFDHVVSKLNELDRGELAAGIVSLKDAILASQSLSEKDKEEHIEILNVVAVEAAKEQPNKTMLRVLGDGLLAALKVAPGIAVAATALQRLLQVITK